MGQKKGFRHTKETKKLISERTRLAMARPEVHKKICKARNRFNLLSALNRQYKRWPDELKKRKIDLILQRKAIVKRIKENTAPELFEDLENELRSVLIKMKQLDKDYQTYVYYKRKALKAERDNP